MPSITGANSTYALSISTIFPSPQLLQGYAADDSFSTEPIEVAEVMMGVDGLLSGGYVNVPVKQTISLQADSLSNTIFEQWVQAQLQADDVYIASGLIVLPSIGRKFTMVKGFLTTYPPIAEVKKLLQPRRYSITWQAAMPQNI